MIEPPTREGTELVGRINAERSQNGIVVPFDDLLIGTCALALRCSNPQRPALSKDTRAEYDLSLDFCQRPLRVIAARGAFFRLAPPFVQQVDGAYLKPRRVIIKKSFQFEFATT